MSTQENKPVWYVHQNGEVGLLQLKGSVADFKLKMREFYDEIKSCRSIYKFKESLSKFLNLFRNTRVYYHIIQQYKKDMAEFIKIRNRLEAHLNHIYHEMEEYADNNNMKLAIIERSNACSSDSVHKSTGSSPDGLLNFLSSIKTNAYFMMTEHVKHREFLSTLLILSEVSNYDVSLKKDILIPYLKTKNELEDKRMFSIWHHLEKIDPSITENVHLSELNIGDSTHVSELNNSLNIIYNHYVQNEDNLD